MSEQAIRTFLPTLRPSPWSVRLVMTVPLVLLPFLLGGARPWFQGTVGAVFLAGVAAVVWTDHGLDVSAVLSRRAAAVLGFLVLIPFVQAAPLPSFVIEALSPERARWIARAADATGSNPLFSAISYDPAATLASAMWIAGLAVFAVMLRAALENERNLDWLFRVILAVALFQASYGLLQVLIPKLPVLWESPGQGVARGTFVNRNNFACFLGMIWPLLLARSIAMSRIEGIPFRIRPGKKTRRPITEEPIEPPRDEPQAPADPPARAAADEPTRAVHMEHRRHRNTRRSKSSGRSTAGRADRLMQARQKQLFYTLILGIVLLSLFFSQSRGGIIGALTALTVFSAFGILRRRGMILFVAGCWLVMIAYGSIIGFGDILERFDHLGEAAPARWNIWTDTWALIAQHPAAGVGVGSYPDVIRLYQSHLTDQFQVVDAHNDYLQLAAEIGIPLALAVIALVWGSWWTTAFRLWKRPGGSAEAAPVSAGASANALQADAPASPTASPVSASREPDISGREEQDRILAVGALAGASAFLVHAWVEFNWQIPANQLYFVVLMVVMGRRRVEGSGG